MSFTYFIFFSQKIELKFDVLLHSFFSQNKKHWENGHDFFYFNINTMAQILVSEINIST